MNQIFYTLSNTAKALTIRALQDANAPIDAEQIKAKAEAMMDKCDQRYPVNLYLDYLIKQQKQGNVIQVGLEKHSLLPTWEINTNHGESQ